MKKPNVTPRLMNCRDVCVLTSLSRTSVWLKAKNGTFPKPIDLGGRKAFVREEVEAWIDQQIAHRDDRVVNKTAQRSIEAA